MKTLLKNKPKTILILFFIFYFCFYMTDAAFGYFAIYLKSIGYSPLQMGMLTAGASFAAMLIQPYMGMLTDRSRSKNRILIFLILFSAVLAPLLLLSKSFFYMLLIYIIFQSVRNVQRPISDTITLEFAQENQYRYGPIRMMGCIGYSVMAMWAGRVAEDSIPATFLLFCIACVVSAAVFLPIPHFSGHQSKKAKATFRLLLQNKNLVLLTAFAVVFSITKSLFHSYYSIYFTGELGGTAGMYGLLLSVGALCEIPFMFFSDSIIKKFGPTRTLVLSGLLDTLRWGLTFMITDPFWQMVVHMICGMNNMVIHTAMTMTINKSVDPELKATAQTTFASVTSLAAMIFGNLLGGALANAFGLRFLFLFMSIADCVAVLAFMPALKKIAQPLTGR